MVGTGKGEGNGPPRLAPFVGDSTAFGWKAASEVDFHFRNTGKHGHSILIPIKDTLFPFILMGIFGLSTSQTEVPLCPPQYLPAFRSSVHFALSKTSFSAISAQ